MSDEKPGRKETFAISKCKSWGSRCKMKSPHILAKEVLPWNLWTRKHLKGRTKRRGFGKGKLYVLEIICVCVVGDRGMLIHCLPLSTWNPPSSVEDKSGDQLCFYTGDQSGRNRRLALKSRSLIMDMCDICRLVMPGDHPCCLSPWIKVVYEKLVLFSAKVSWEKAIGPAKRWLDNYIWTTLTGNCVKISLKY